MSRRGWKEATVENRMTTRLLLCVMIGAVGVSLIGGFPAPAAAQKMEEVVVTDTKLRTDDGAGDYDPWESYNEPVFKFNYKLDKYVVKPFAKGYNLFIGDGEKQVITNVFDNVAMPKRFINSLLQGKFGGAGREMARFLINTTLGGAGMTDVAKYQFGIERSDEDTGQTFATWGWDRSRYFVVPLLSPLTVRDTVGYVFDLALDPINYFIPLGASVGKTAEDKLNYRAQNVETFEAVEEGTLDLYSAVRNAYLKKREKQIRE
ncbi:MAG: VacJ family lipoprotein [Nitrospirae bacterium]|nr:MAG: VacJ family lipoprotein [Nitrospirota bacterium]